MFFDRKLQSLWWPCGSAILFSFLFYFIFFFSLNILQKTIDEGILAWAKTRFEIAYPCQLKNLNPSFLLFLVFQERICEEAVSFDLTSFDIASCVEDLDRCLETVTRMEEEGTLLLNDDSGKSFAC